MATITISGRTLTVRHATFGLLKYSVYPWLARADDVSSRLGAAIATAAGGGAAVPVHLFLEQAEITIDGLMIFLEGVTREWLEANADPEHLAEVRRLAASKDSRASSEAAPGEASRS